MKNHTPGIPQINSYDAADFCHLPEAGTIMLQFGSICGKASLK